jgi:uncharacterized OB-fold protein
VARPEYGRSNAGSALLGAGPEAEFRAHLQAGQRSRSTGEHVFYPRVAAPGGEQDLEWVEASGEGTIYAITVNRSREGAYNVALVDLVEGPRLMSRIEGTESLPIGATVRARIAGTAEDPAIVFDPVDG